MLLFSLLLEVPLPPPLDLLERGLWVTPSESVKLTLNPVS